MPFIFMKKKFFTKPRTFQFSCEIFLRKLRRWNLKILVNVMSFQCNSSRMSQNISCFYLMSFYFRFFDSLRPTKCNKVGVNLFCNSVPHNDVRKMGNFSYHSQIWSQNWTPPSKIVYPFQELLQKATAAAKSLSWIFKLLTLPPCRHSKDNGTIQE